MMYHRAVALVPLASRTPCHTHAIHTTACVSVSRRTRRQVKRQKDEDLRHAISLYHITPAFYRTDVAGDKDQELRDEVAESILGPFLNHRSGRSFVQCSNTHELMHHQREAWHTARRDTLSEMDTYENAGLPSSFLSKMSTSLPPRHRQAHDSDGLRAHFVKPPSAYSTRRARDTAGHGDLYAQDELSLRSAQVRDALYGTVAGELPGLEIVREYELDWDAHEKK